GLLMCTYGTDGQMSSVSDFQFWPQWSAGEFGGVVAAHLQSQGYGGRGIKELCDWCFEHIGVRLLVMTSALDNVRSYKIFKSMGFQEMGEIDSVRPDGKIRRSRYWELIRA
ncbi:MAG TPA: N-acetyltransferase, partial [Hellea balneolensis]|nr:N-acetyltransferase [Hellea balneolensis]